MQNETGNGKILKEPEAARYIGMSVPYLRLSRMEGRREGKAPGPPFIKIGKSVRYDVNDLDRFLESKKVRT